MYTKYICAEQFSCGFNVFNKLKKFSTIFKITLLGWFFSKLTLNLTILKGFPFEKMKENFLKGFPFKYWRRYQYFGNLFFLVRFNFKGNSHIKLKVISNFGGIEFLAEPLSRRKTYAGKNKKRWGKRKKEKTIESEKQNRKENKRHQDTENEKIL